METKAANFDPAFLEDHYRAAVAGLLRAKKAELPLEATPAKPSPQKVANLMDALRRSLDAERPRRPTPRLVATTSSPKSKPARGAAPRKAGGRRSGSAA
jgi:non-homologous end joining protein Ku